MEEYHQITLNEWQQWREEIRQKLKEAAGNFVYIGYRLKQIRDSGMFDGAADVFEFAQREYGLSKSTVSRFIAVSEKFSDPDHPLLLRKEYELMGSSKLSEMLTLPDNECEMISEQSTVKDIRSLKEFNREAENVINTQETADSGTEKPQNEAESTDQNTAELVENSEKSEIEMSHFEKCIYDFFRDKSLKDAFNLICHSTDEESEKKAYELINPSGAKTHKKGLCFISMLNWDRGVRYKLMIESAPHSLTWHEFFDTVGDMVSMLINGDDINKEDIWSVIYAENGINERAETDSKKPEKKETKQAPETPKPAEIEPVATSQQEEVTPAGVEEAEEASGAAGVKEEIAPAQPEEIEVLNQRELERIANGLRSLADQFEAGSGGNLYSNPIEELEGMRSEIMALPGELLPVIENAIRRKRAV